MTTPIPTTPKTTRTLVPQSPHYTTTRRHSLYGTEDRVVIDTGSLIWKVGFSGEGKPRNVFYPSPADKSSLWNLNCAHDPAARLEETRVMMYKVEQALRKVFHDCLLTDPKSRKVIIIEHPLLPSYVKNALAHVLFDNLQVPSISFAPSHLLSLIGAGRITGLVLDCGHLESVALPIFASRPLYPLLKTTPLAGSRLRAHLRTLLTCFASYQPPAQSLNAAIHHAGGSRSTRVPPELLTNTLLETILTRCCFVSTPLDSNTPIATPTPLPHEDEPIEVDPPPQSSDSMQSDSEHSHTEQDSAMSTQDTSEHPPNVLSDDPDEDRYLRTISSLYRRHSTATDVNIRVAPPNAHGPHTSLGILVIPGWIRERVAEVLFDRGDVDESSVAELILDALLKAPVDLRRTLASSILIVGGTAMLPGFIPRLQQEVLSTIEASFRPTTPGRASLPHYDKYAALRPLVPAFSVINNPSPPPPLSERAAANAGKAPAFTPSLLAWVGGSLAGSLKTGGAEISREKWDEAGAARGEDDEMVVLTAEESEAILRDIIPDWTHIPLSPGAPHAPRQASVGA